MDAPTGAKSPAFGAKHPYRIGSNEILGEDGHRDTRQKSPLPQLRLCHYALSKSMDWPRMVTARPGASMVRSTAAWTRISRGDIST